MNPILNPCFPEELTGLINSVCWLLLVLPLELSELANEVNGKLTGLVNGAGGSFSSDSHQILNNEYFRIRFGLVNSINSNLRLKF